MRRLDRRWWVAIAVAVVALAGFVLSETVFSRPSEECKPVLDLLQYNSDEGKKIAAKHGDGDPAIPTVAEDAVYQQWADGLAQRAQEVNDPNLANTSVQVANLASQFVAKLPAARAAAESHAPGAPAPPVIFEMSMLNERIADGLDQLSKACNK